MLDLDTGFWARCAAAWGEEGEEEELLEEDAEYLGNGEYVLSFVFNGNSRILKWRYVSTC